jgi:DNA segregation ATPase FtsK/SpoIIIE, S-DNA-T family
MDLTLTVVVAATGGSADVRLAAPDSSSAAVLLSKVRQAAGAAPDCPLSLAGRDLVGDGTVADCGLAAGAVIVAGRSLPVPAAALADLLVTSGPDSGRQVALASGDHVVGRSPHCDVPLADPTISRRHLMLSVSANATTVTDLISANGVLVDGELLTTGDVVTAPFGVAIRLGDSEIVLERHRQPQTGGLSSDRVAIHRQPRLVAPPAIVDVTFPPAPAPTTPVRVPAIAAVTPLIAGIALSLVLHQWQFLAFTALSPIMVLGQAGSDRWSSRRAARTARREHDEATAVAARQLAEALHHERARRHNAAPDLGHLMSAAAQRGSRLWHRGPDDPDLLRLRVGRGDLPSETRVIGAGPVTVADVPVCVSLSEVAVLGVSGPPDLRAGMARSLVMQVATLHSPADVQLVILAPGRPREWAWVRWLPHVAAVDGEPCTALVGFDDDQANDRVNELRNREPKRPRRAAHTVVVVDGNETLRNSAAMSALLGCPPAGTSIVWCAASTSGLPGACRAIVELCARPRLHLTVSRTGQPKVATATPDLLAAEVADAAARTLAPLHSGDTSTGYDVPTTVPWSEISGVDLHDRATAVRSVTHQWSLTPSSEITLGRGPGGPVRIDLCTDGPHALIAGTTGSGKSELLIGLVASLAARNRPDQLSLLLIDHKGGAAFNRCARLPHAIGVVTDLDSASTKRALLSLGAELRRRERLFAAVGVTDLESFAAAVSLGNGSEPLARLVIVVDEFAALAEEQPDFVGGLVGIAQRGRSLGVHLVLATQRPDGVVSADIRANTRLRICLAVARDSESRDVIDSLDASSISRRTPGRAYLRVGPGDLREFQSAFVSSRGTTVDDSTATLSPAASLGDPPPPPTSDLAVDPLANTELDTLVEVAVEVAASLRCIMPKPPWLPPLPDRLPTATLPAATDADIATWGLADLPAVGQQAPLRLDLRNAGTTVIAGTARSGRTSAALTLAVTAASRRSPDRLNLWAIDAGTGLAALSELPHCGGVVPAHDLDRVERLLAHLGREIARRRQDPGGDDRVLMLIVDSWESLAATGDGRDHLQLVDTLLRLVSDGPSAGLHVIITSDRGGLVGRLGATAAEKIVLRLTDPADFAIVGLAARDVPRQLPPGRGVRATDLALVHVGCLDDITTAAARAWPAPQPPVRRFDLLPRRVSLADLTAPEGATGDQFVLGLRAEDLNPQLLQRADVGCALVIAGPASSGRSSAVLLLARQLSGRTVAVSCSRRSPLAEFADAIQLPRDDQDHAVAVLDSLYSNDNLAPDILIDDIDLLPDGPLWTRLEELIGGRVDGGTGRDDDALIVLAGSTDAFAAAFRGPMARARRAQTGLLLCPTSPHDGELFGLALPRRGRDRCSPGRGWLAVRGTATFVQLADPATITPGSLSPRPSPSEPVRRPVPAPLNAPGFGRRASTNTAPGPPR